MNGVKKETSVAAEVENVTLRSNVYVDPNEFIKILESAPMGRVTDKPLPLKPCNVSKVFDDSQC